MSPRPSDVGRPRDDSLVGTLRRYGVWLTVAFGLALVPLMAVQLAAVLQGHPLPPLTWRTALTMLLRLANTDAGWPERVALGVGVAVSGAAFAAVATVVWSAGLRASGLHTADQRLLSQLDGARWATEQDLAPLLVRPDQVKNRLVLGTPREPRVRRERLVAVQAEHSALVVAPTGQGKTESVMVPAILDFDGPVLVVSIKRDVYDLTAGYRSQFGETRVLDPAGLTDPTQVRHAYWTPLAEARSWRAARMLADQMAGVGRKGAQASANEDYFAQAAGELLAGLFFTAAHSPIPSMHTVSTWLGDPEAAIETIQQLLTGLEDDETLPDDVRFNAPHALRSITLRMIGKDPRTVEPIRASAGNIIRAWEDYRLADIEPTDPGVLDPDWLWAPPQRWEQPGGRRTLYVICPDAEQGTYEGLMIGAVTQAYNAYGRAGQQGQAPKMPLRIVLDEVANTAPIPKLDTWVTAARGLGISLVVATQNLAQLDTVWGREKAETIASGPRVRMFGPGLADQQTLAYIEKISGETGVLSETESRHPYLLQLPSSRATQTQWRPLVPQHTAREIPPFTGLVFSGSIPPFTVTWRAGATDPALRRKQQLAPVPPGAEEVEYLDTPRGERLLALSPGVETGPRPDPVGATDEDWGLEDWRASDDLLDDDEPDEGSWT